MTNTSKNLSANTNSMKTGTNVMNLEMDMMGPASDRMEGQGLSGALALIADFYDSCKYGCEGTEGYRKSTDLVKLTRIFEDLREQGFIHPDRTVFVDLGCADGRVNVLASYFVKVSIGIEIDQAILDEFPYRFETLLPCLEAMGLPRPPDNLFLTPGSSLDDKTYSHIQKCVGCGFGEIDLFYTYITLHDLFGEKIAAEARPGALYLVYGFNRVLPSYDGLELLLPDVAGQGIAALYRKKG